MPIAGDDPLASRPMVSVVVAVRNGAATLQRCIDSVRAQTCKKIELIIIDGVSTDGTVEIIEKNSIGLAYWESTPDRGIYEAMNKGIRKSKGDWVLFLGADDYLWSSDLIESLQDRFKELFDKYRIVYGKVAVVDEQGKTLELVGRPWEEVKHVFHHEMSIPHQGVFHSRRLFEEHGLFCEDFKIAGDFDLLLRELKSGEAYFLGDIVIAGMQLGGISSLPESTLKAVREFKQARKKNGLTLPSFWLFKRAFRAEIRQLIKKFFGESVANSAADFYRVMVGKPRLWHDFKRRD